MTIYTAPALQAWSSQLLQRSGVDAAAAATTAEVLIRTSLRGIDTHGISRLPGYVDKLRCGEMRAHAEPRREWRDGVLCLDGGGGLGQPVACAAVGELVARTEETALAACTIARTGHLAALGLFVLQAAERGRVAWLCQRTMPLMALAGARGAAIGNNPLAFAAPVAGGVPLVFDMATSIVARGNVIQARRDGVAIPEGWAIGPDGRPTTDAALALEGAMLPMAGHKGIGLAMMVECLAGALSGVEDADDAKAGRGGYSGNASAFLFVLNPERLIGRAAFDAGMRRWLDRYLGQAGPQARYPGQRQADCERERRISGIPVPDSVIGELCAAGNAAGFPFDLPALQA